MRWNPSLKLNSIIEIDIYPFPSISCCFNTWEQFLKNHYQWASHEWSLRTGVWHRNGALADAPPGCQTRQEPRSPAHATGRPGVRTLSEERTTCGKAAASSWDGTLRRKPGGRWEKQTWTNLGHFRQKMETQSEGTTPMFTEPNTHTHGTFSQSAAGIFTFFPCFLRIGSF